MLSSDFCRWHHAMRFLFNLKPYLDFCKEELYNGKHLFGCSVYYHNNNKWSSSKNTFSFFLKLICFVSSLEILGTHLKKLKDCFWVYLNGFCLYYTSFIHPGIINCFVSIDDHDDDCPHNSDKGVGRSKVEVGQRKAISDVLLTPALHLHPG